MALAVSATKRRSSRIQGYITSTPRHLRERVVQRKLVDSSVSLIFTFNNFGHVTKKKILILSVTSNVILTCRQTRLQEREGW